MKRASVTVAVLALALSGCFFMSKKPAQSQSSQPATSEPKNHGQQRSEEVHDRNDARKDAKDAEKGK